MPECVCVCEFVFWKIDLYEQRVHLKHFLFSMGGSYHSVHFVLYRNFAYLQDTENIFCTVLNQN